MNTFRKQLLLTLSLLFAVPGLLSAKKYSINGICTIEVGSELELQTNRSHVDATTIGEITFLKGDRIVFQQYGLNDNYSWAFNKYARIIIVTGEDEKDSFPACNEAIEVTPTDKEEFLSFAKDVAAPFRITKGPSLSITEVNNHPCIKVSFEREGNLGGAHVESYYLFNDSQFVKIVTSYALPDKTEFRSALNSAVESFSWNTPHFAVSQKKSLSKEQKEYLDSLTGPALMAIGFWIAILYWIIKGIVKLVKKIVKKIKEPATKPENKLQAIVKPENSSQTIAKKNVIKLPPPLPQSQGTESDIAVTPSIDTDTVSCNKNDYTVSGNESENTVPPTKKDTPEDKVYSILRVDYPLASSGKHSHYPYWLAPEKGSIVYPHRYNKGKIRGYSEELFETLLRNTFTSKQLDVNGQVNLKFSDTSKSYEPDIAIIANNGSLRLDIEIDEPYSLVSRVPIHYTEDNSDEVRDTIMKSSGWIVLRFAEEQIVREPEACLSAIALLLYQVDPSFVPASCSISKSPKPVKKWSKAEAEQMAANNYREKYLDINGPVSPQEKGKEDNQPLTEQEIAVKSMIGNFGNWGDAENRTNQKYNANNVSDRDSRIEFFPESHTYILDGVVNLLPVTTVISKHFPAFDGPRIAEKMVQRGKGRTVQEVLDEFSYKGTLAREVGTFMHEQIEKIILGDDTQLEYDFCFDSSSIHTKEKVSIKKEISQFKDFMSKHKITPYRSEWRIFDEQHGIAGTIDLLAKVGDKYVMYDWKRSLKVVNAFSDGRYSIQTNGFASGHGALAHLDDSSFNHYCLQQNIYRYILRTWYGINVAQMFLVVFHNEYDNYFLIPVPPMDKEINAILNGTNC